MSKSNWFCEVCEEDTHCPECNTCFDCVVDSHEKRIKELERELQALREAIQEHKDSFNNPDDHTCEDLKLWKALLEKADE